MEDTTHDDFTAREAQGWASFEAAVNAVPRDRQSEPSMPDGWSVKDLVWHVAYWWEMGAESFERIASGDDVEGESGDTDEINATALAQSRAMSLQDVEAGVIRIRERLLRAWASVRGDAAAADTFEGETFLHYDDHRAALEALTPP